MNKRLTVNLGLRYEPYTPWSELAGRWERFFPQDYYAGMKSTVFVNAPVGETFRGSPGVPYDGTTGDYTQPGPAPRLCLRSDRRRQDEYSRRRRFLLRPARLRHHQQRRRGRISLERPCELHESL